VFWDNPSYFSFYSRKHQITFLKTAWYGYFKLLSKLYVINVTLYILSTEGVNSEVQARQRVAARGIFSKQ
jgi:hypothetical protein